MDIDMAARPFIASHPNLRCLGGIAAVDGRRVRALRFLRAPALTGLLPDEAAWLESLDPAVIIDFRGDSEVTGDLVNWPQALAARRLSLPVVASAENRFHAAVAAGTTTPETFRALMAETYRDFVRVHHATFSRFLRAVAEAGAQPVLFHCTAGKDRTGVAAALLLLALGAPRDAIMADFLATAALWTPGESLRARMPAAAHDAVFGVEPAYLEAALEELDALPGGLDHFLHEALGGVAARAAFAERHLEAA